MDGFRLWDDCTDGDTAFDLAAECPPEMKLDDRRLHVRLYNRWSVLRYGRAFPAIRDMAPGSLDGPGAILLDLRGADGDPRLVHAGTALLRECGREAVERVSAIPQESMLAKLAGHYPAILSAREPMAFEGEHRRPCGEAVLYRGILLPLSATGASIDFIHGVISWRAFADSETTAGIAFEVGRSFAAAACVAGASDPECAAFARLEPKHPELPLGA